MNLGSLHKLLVRKMVPSVINNPGPVDQRHAMKGFQTLRKELSTLSKVRSSATTKGEPGTIVRRATSRFNLTRTRTSKGVDPEAAGEIEEDPKTGTDLEQGTSEEDEFELDTFLRDGYFEKRTIEGNSAKKVGVVFKGLTVHGFATKASFAKTLPDAVMGTFGPDLYHLLSRFFTFSTTWKKRRAS